MVGHLDKLDSGLRELRRTADVELHERVDLRAWTTLGVGGVAALVARCHSINGVRDTLDLAASHGLGWVTLGGGSRLITPDTGIRVPVLSLTGEAARWETELDGIVAGGGANLAQVCRAAFRNGLSGLETVDGDRHSIGGLVMAASAGVVRLGTLLDWVDLQGPGAAVERWCATRSEGVPGAEKLRRRVVVRARFRLRPEGIRRSREPGDTATPTRSLKTTGPVFLDTVDARAADLLEEAGYGTASAGGVRLGGPHGNALIAGRSASAADVLDLCRRVRDRVAAATGIELQPALVFVDGNGLEVEL